MASISATVTLRGNAQKNARELQTQLQRATARAVRAAATATKAEIIKTLRQAIGPDERMSNVGRAGGGAKLSVRFDLTGATTANPSSFVKAVGPWPLIETSQKRHVIASRKLARGVRTRLRTGGFATGGPAVFQGRRGAVVATPWGPRAYVIHPGTRGKKPWARGVTAVTPKVQKIYRATLNDAVARSGWGR